MWKFYWSIMRLAVRELWTATNGFLTAVAVLSFFAILTNRQYGEKLVTAWNGISPWWSIIPIALLVVYRLLRANYETFVKIQRERDDAEAKFSMLPEFRPCIVPVAFGKAEKRDDHGIHLRNSGYDAIDIEIPPAPIGSCGYLLTFDEHLAQLGERSGIAFIEARLDDPKGAAPGRDGRDLHSVMAFFGVEEIEFFILYKDTDFRQYRTRCIIERTNRTRNGLEVRAISQEIVPKRPALAAEAFSRSQP